MNNYKKTKRKRNWNSLKIAAISIVVIFSWVGIGALLYDNLGFMHWSTMIYSALSISFFVWLLIDFKGIVKWVKSF